LDDVKIDIHFDALRQQTVLAKFGELALACDNLDEILTEACRLVGEALGTELAKVMELQEDGETLLVRAGVGWKPGVVGEVTLQATEDSSEGHALKTGEPMISPDIDKETRFKYPSFLTENGVKAVANVIIIGGQDKPPYGILQIDSRRPRQFNVNDTTFLRSYANLLAAAVDRLRVMEVARDREERLRLALEAGEMGSWELNLIKGAFYGASRTLEIFGYTEPLPVWDRDSFFSHVRAEDRDRVKMTLSDALNRGSEWYCQCRIQRVDNGEIRWIELRARPAGARGNVPATHLHGIVVDITAHKSIEEIMQRANEKLEATVAERTQELVEANRRLLDEAKERELIEEALRQSQKMEAVGQLTGGLAHDFNNLLTGIAGNLELLQARITQGRITDMQRYVVAAQGSATRAAALTHRLLAFSRRQTLEARLTDANDLVSGLADMVRQTTGQGIDVEIVLMDGLWKSFVDPNQLENALLNLCINARDAMPDGGKLIIETANKMFDERSARKFDVSAGQYMSLTVSDNGVGMAPDVAARAFDPFYTTKPLGLGTGLGLSMIYGFARQSGGQVRIHSEPGKGTAVSLYLPRQLGVEELPMAVAELAEPAQASQGTTVLVIDDEPTVRMLVTEVLEDLGYIIIEAKDAAGGLRVLQSNARIDLLITDVGLPGGMNGRQLADAAREQRPGLKVLFITGYAETAMISHGHLDPGMHVMSKPFKIDTLANRVSDLIAAK
jgi:PAS domain S-box-containing protein